MLVALSAIGALVALVGVGGASADTALGGLANGSRLPAVGAFGQAGFGSTPAQLPDASRSSVPSPGHDSELETVACVKASECWAVGNYHKSNNSNSAFLNEALRWNGKRWSTAKTPNPGGSASGDSNDLFGVDCVSASDCWAVGESQRGSSAPEVNEALRFNGRKWSKAKTPNPGGTASGDLSELFGVTCVSASDCWAVGQSQHGSSAAKLNEALRWNGKKWSKVKTFDPAGKDNGKTNELLGVSCVSASDCWAVGEGANPNKSVDFNEVLHWGGKKWSHVTTPQPSNKSSPYFNPLFSVDCNSANDCWAVGYYFNNNMTAIVNDALHWNGSKWSHVHTPQPAGTNDVFNALLGVTCPSRSDCRAVGLLGPLGNFSNEALHYNGKRWSSQ